MGAIAGIKYFDNTSEIDKELIFKMIALLQHRAPNYKIQMLNGSGVFGFRYHSLGRDINKFAHDDSKNLWVILDGEIFSVKSNDSFSSDSEVILRLYCLYGENFIDKIDGSYSIAIWDEAANKLLLIRDRVGYKPLFYFRSKHVIIFASEIKAILSCNYYNKSVNLKNLNNFLSYGYVPSPETLFESIYQVKPGHMLICKDGNICEKLYWKFKYRPDRQYKPEKYYREKFLEIFKIAVSRRLKKYPDVGAFLSGGLDTSGVVAIMHKLKEMPFRVFTAGFKEEQYNEISDAKVVADHFGLKHYTIIVEYRENFNSLLERLVWHHDSPFADTSAIPSYFAAKLAKEYMNVVLTGDFPDQLIGGSGHHIIALSRLRHDPLIYKFLRHKNIHRFIINLHWSAGCSSIFDRIKRLLYRETFPLEEQRIILSMPIPELLKQCLYSTEMLKINAQYDPISVARSIYKGVEDQDLLNKILYFDMVSYAPDDLMLKVERMTMSQGLNAISPFHDIELIEFIQTLPTYLKIKDDIRKYIMREALRSMLPEYILKKKKKGFAMPIKEWLMKKSPNYVREILFDSRTLNRGYFNKKYMIRMVENFLSDKTDYASGSEAAIISLITLELWHRIFIDK